MDPVVSVDCFGLHCRLRAGCSSIATCPPGDLSRSDVCHSALNQRLLTIQWERSSWNFRRMPNVDECGLDSFHDSIEQAE